MRVDPWRIYFSTKYACNLRGTRHVDVSQHDDAKTTKTCWRRITHSASACWCNDSKKTCWRRTSNQRRVDVELLPRLCWQPRPSLARQLLSFPKDPKTQRDNGLTRCDDSTYSDQGAVEFSGASWPLFSPMVRGHRLAVMLITRRSLEELLSFQEPRGIHLTKFIFLFFFWPRAVEPSDSPRIGSTMFAHRRSSTAGPRRGSLPTSLLTKISQLR